jgi:hypothetical protein
MDETLLLLLALVLTVVIASIAVLKSRTQREALTAGAPSRFAASTEGMSVCPKCGMGNLWTERRCSACGTSLKR